MESLDRSSHQELLAIAFAGAVHVALERQRLEQGESAH